LISNDLKKIYSPQRHRLHRGKAEIREDYAGKRRRRGRIEKEVRRISLSGFISALPLCTLCLCGEPA